MANLNDTENERTVTNIELVDIEDIVPNSGNSLFLCVARVLIYMSYKNPTFVTALNVCCDIEKAELKSDLGLQLLLRKKLCDYLCENGTVYDKNTNKLGLSDEYKNFFNGNIYDFLIQVYQLGINNFSNNALFRKYALPTLSKILNMSIFYKRTNGQWKYYEPTSKNKNIQDDVEKTKLMNFLSECTIYLQEFRADSSYINKNFSFDFIPCTKNVRILLDKNLWLSKQQENSKICMKFSQFNDSEELKKYEIARFCMDSSKIINLFNLNEHTDIIQRIFCIFINNVQIQSLIYAEYTANKSTTNKIQLIENGSEKMEFINEKELKEMEFSGEYNTIGKQFSKFSKLGKDRLIQYLNYLWGKKIFTDDYLDRKYLSIRN